MGGNKLKKCKIINDSQSKYNDFSYTRKLELKKQCINNKRIQYQRVNNINFDIIITSRCDIVFYPSIVHTNINGTGNYLWYSDEYKADDMDKVFFEIPNIVYDKINETKEKFNIMIKEIMNNDNLIIVNNSTMGKKGFSLWEGISIAKPNIMDIYCNFDSSIKYKLNDNIWKNGRNYYGQLEIYLLKK